MDTEEMAEIKLPSGESHGDFVKRERRAELFARRRMAGERVSTLEELRIRAHRAPQSGNPEWEPLREREREQAHAAQRVRHAVAPQCRIALPGGRTLSAGEEVIVARDLAGRDAALSELHELGVVTSISAADVLRRSAPRGQYAATRDLQGLRKVFHRGDIVSEADFAPSKPPPKYTTDDLVQLLADGRKPITTWSNSVFSDYCSSGAIVAGEGDDDEPEPEAA